MAYTLRDRRDVPAQTNICALFWRGLAVLFSEGLLASLVGLALAYVVVYGDVAAGVGIGLALIAGISAVLYGLIWALATGTQKGVAVTRTVATAMSLTVPAQAFKSWKEKHCALVRIVEVEE